MNKSGKKIFSDVKNGMKNEIHDKILAKTTKIYSKDIKGK
jgi:hypothetical protein